VGGSDKASARFRPLPQGLAQVLPRPARVSQFLLALAMTAPAWHWLLGMVWVYQCVLVPELRSWFRSQAAHPLLGKVMLG
jgi:hypothetical protein